MTWFTDISKYFLNEITDTTSNQDRVGGELKQQVSSDSLINRIINTGGELGNIEQNNKDGRRLIVTHNHTPLGQLNFRPFSTTTQAQDLPSQASKPLVTVGAGLQSGWNLPQGYHLKVHKVSVISIDYKNGTLKASDGTSWTGLGSTYPSNKWHPGDQLEIEFGLVGVYLVTGPERPM